MKPPDRPNPFAHPEPRPAGDGKDPDILVDLVSAKNNFEADVIAQALAANGIPAHAFTSAANILQWEVIMTDPYRVQVRRGDLAKARALLADLKPDAASIDWDAVDVGDTPEAENERNEALKGPKREHRILFMGVVIGLIAIVVFLAIISQLPVPAPTSP